MESIGLKFCMLERSEEYRAYTNIRYMYMVGYRGTSLTRNTPLLGPYSSTAPRVL
jgi:hypothetical protein